MGKFSENEIENKYNLIKMLLAEYEKYIYAMDSIKRDISYTLLELKRKLEEEKITL